MKGRNFFVGVIVAIYYLECWWRLTPDTPTSSRLPPGMGSFFQTLPKIDYAFILFCIINTTGQNLIPDVIFRWKKSSPKCFVAFRCAYAITPKTNAAVANKLRHFSPILLGFPPSCALNFEVMYMKTYDKILLNCTLQH